jgi:PAS domain S-box-containing protein
MDPNPLINLDLLCAAVFEAATEGILLCDAEGIILQANPACHRLFGYPAGGMAGMPVAALMPEALRQRHGQHLSGFFRRPEPRPMGQDLDLQGLRRDGSTFFLEISLTFAQTQQGGVGVAFISDISERRRRDRELQASADKYNSVIEHAVDGIIVIDQQGRIELVNPAVEKLFGYEASELKGKSVNVLMPQPYREEHDGYLDRYHRTGERRIIGIGREVRGRKKDGSIFPLALSVSEVQVEERVIYTGIIHDLTQQKAYEQQLKEYSEQLEHKVRERTMELEELNTYLEEQMEELMQAQDAVKRSENMYKLIARNFPNGTINVFDRELRYIFVEGKELFELGITGEKLIGTKFIHRLDPRIAPIAQQELMEVFKGLPRTFEIELRGQHYVLNAVPLTDGPNHEVHQILVVERNITKQKKAEEDIRMALEKEQQLGELKSRFVTMASHEFRTPLTTIASSATLIGKYTLESQQDKRDKHVQRIHTNVRHLTNILNDFLSLGKLEEGKVANQPETFDLPLFCRELLDELRPTLAEGQGIGYRHEGEHLVVLDPKLLRNILLNLLSNAIKYSRPGKPIGLATRRHPNDHPSGRQIEVLVQDQGIGIPAEDLPHLFTRFFRATNTGNIQGTGMGLNIVKKYVDLMDGQIEVASKQHEGTLFTVRF